jgi:hypothetical protein
MKQSRLMSFIESLINIAVGFSISVAAQAVFLPLLGVAISLGANLAFAAVMTAISIARSYLLRRLFEALNLRRPLSPAMCAIIAERIRQVEVEGWTAEHDEEHGVGELAQAGACYALAGRELTIAHPYKRNLSLPVPVALLWPWEQGWWKPQDVRRNLVRAGALILAELERHDRRKRKPAPAARVRSAA